MKYLISHQIKMLAGCLKDVQYVWDIIPIILRLSFENPKLSMDILKAKGWLVKYDGIFKTLTRDLETAQAKNVIFSRPHKVFTMADSLLKNFNKMDNKSDVPDESSEVKNYNEFLEIVKILHERVLSLLKKILSSDDLKIMDEIVLIMDTNNFPFKTQSVIQKSIKRKEELKEELQKGPETNISRTARREIKVFLDMDGCICHFDKAVKKLGPKATKGLSDDATEEERQYMYDKIEDKGSKFWSEMEWYPKGQELWKVVKKYDPILLSSPGKFLWAPAGKQDWVNANLPGITLFLDEDKYKFAEMDSVLIDDSAPNIAAWQDAGGIGILYEDNPEIVKEELKKIASV